MTRLTNGQSDDTTVDEKRRSWVHQEKEKLPSQENCSDTEGRGGLAEHLQHYPYQLIGGCSDEDDWKHGQRGGDCEGDESWLVNGHDSHFSYDSEACSKVSL